MKQSKSLGQVFLKEARFHTMIVDALPGGGTILEIGPGEGQISLRIAQKVKKLYCIELDRRFYTLLTDKFKPQANITLVNGDILKFDISAIPDTLVVFGNVPYYLSTDLIHYLIAHKSRVTDAYLTLQKEFAEKLIAQPGTYNYCFSTCLLQYHAQTAKLFDIPKQAFSPIPKVDSSFMHIRFLTEPPQGFAHEKILFDIIKKAFSQRRKKIANSLRHLSQDKNFFKDLDIDENLRPENLSLEDYIALARYCADNNRGTTHA